jgi:hypothetical protein
MSEKLNTITGKQNDFATRFMGGDDVPIGSSPDGTGRAITLTPPAGQRVRLTHLSTSAGDELAGMSIVFGSTTVVSSLALNGDLPNSTARFSVGSFQEYTAGVPPLTNYKYWTGGKDEAMSIFIPVAVTTVAFYYGYQFGE